MLFHIVNLYMFRTILCNNLIISKFKEFNRLKKYLQSSGFEVLNMAVVWSFPKIWLCYTAVREKVILMRPHEIQRCPQHRGWEQALQNPDVQTTYPDFKAKCLWFLALWPDIEFCFFPKNWFYPIFSFSFGFLFLSPSQTWISIYWKSRIW